jgi:hypothetical protein
MAKDISRCGQMLPRGEVGTLQADLDCPGTLGSCVLDDAIPCTSSADCPPEDPPFNQCAFDSPLLQDGSTLLLNGHSITSHAPNPIQRWGVLTGSVTIQGPGEISAPGGVAIVFGGDHLRISDVTVRDSRAGITANFGGLIRATNLTVIDNEAIGISNSRRVSGTNIVTSNNGFNTGFPPGTPGVGVGIGAVRVIVDGLTAENNGEAGVFAKSVKLENSVLSGNDGYAQAIDVAAMRRPRLRNTTCGKSGQVTQGSLQLVGSWGVCSGD